MITWDDLPERVQNFLLDIAAVEEKHGLEMGSWGGGDDCVYGPNGEEWRDAGTYLIPEDETAPHAHRNGPASPAPGSDGPT